MAIDYVTQFATQVDEQFTTASMTAALTNRDYDWTGTQTVKVYSVTTASMNDYNRAGEAQEDTISRYGVIEGLDATTQSLMVRKDRSFTFAIDKLDSDETAQALQAASALARQQREVVIPEIDTYVIGQIAANAGQTPDAVNLTSVNIYDHILKAQTALDEAEVPADQRVLVVSPAVYELIKRDPLFQAKPEEIKENGIVSRIDGAAVIKVPTIRLPEKCGFILVHPSATVAPMKLEEYKIHSDPPYISGDLVEGRVVYDAFVLDNKKNGIYYQETPETPETPENP